ncbi:MAG: division/cell wall cluster transcriptional repressor MraZ [Acholeplasmataceae bacterium]|jgi:MraZ protein|nr:division/cell wall cluster transcriptional repressor MraZ [Acholeplasmataceae bacterium]
MLIGEFHYNIDEKGRLFLPSELRTELGSEVVINRGIEKCLYVYPMEEWEKILQKLSTLSFTKKSNREFSRMFLSGAYKREIDAKGRINLDKNLIEYAGLQRECVIIGVGERLELWDKQEWERYYEERRHLLEEISEGIDFDE